jgi:cell wall-associated NlpC family hydrolase
MSETIEVTREDIIREALALVGVPFRHQGDDPEFGLDCRGVLLAIARRLNQTLTREYRKDYSTKPDPVEFRAALVNEFDEIAPDLVAHGDVVLIHVPREPGATHVGVVVPGLKETMLVHASEREGAVVKEPLRRWQRHVRAGFLFRGLTSG